MKYKILVQYATEGSKWVSFYCVSKLSKHQMTEILSWAIVYKRVQKNANNPSNEMKNEQK